jgi:uncharacterized protein YceH (UPF0502 family)
VGERNLQELTEIQARVLACLIEKKETTPDQYPLTTNSLRLACNQKSARNPVTGYTEGEVGHAVRDLINMKLAREAWGARVAKFEHDAGKVLELHRKSLAVISVLILRGPQTAGELKSHTHRLYEFADIDDVNHLLGRLADNHPVFISALPRQPGQKEGRFAHLLCGEPVIPEFQPVSRTHSVSNPAAQELSERINELEETVTKLRNRVNELESKLTG